MNRFVVIDESQSAHCCFVATVIDTLRPTGYEDQCEAICECFSAKDAQRICDAMNKCDISEVL